MHVSGRGRARVRGRARLYANSCACAWANTIYTIDIAHGWPRRRSERIENRIVVIVTFDHGKGSLQCQACHL